MKKIVNSIYISVLSIITIYTSLNMIFEQRKRENTIMRYIGLSKKSMIFYVYQGEYIKANTNIKNIIIVGGERSISSSVEDELKTLR